MIVGGVASFVAPLFGIAHPLDTATQSVIWVLIALAVLAVAAKYHRDPATWIFEGSRVPNLTGVLVSGFLVLVSILGVAELNHTGDNRLAVFGTVLDVGVLLVGIVGGWRRDSKWPLSTLLYGASLALLLSLSLRGGHLYGSDVQKEFSVAWGTIAAGVWRVPSNHDPYASMLSLTVLPAVLHAVTKLRLLAFFELVIPAILALLPVAIFATVRSVPRWVNTGRTVLRHHRIERGFLLKFGNYYSAGDGHYDVGRHHIGDARSLHVEALFSSHHWFAHRRHFIYALHDLLSVGRDSAVRLVRGVVVGTRLAPDTQKRT